MIAQDTIEYTIPIYHTVQLCLKLRRYRTRELWYKHSRVESHASRRKSAVLLSTPSDDTAAMQENIHPQELGSGGHLPQKAMMKTPGYVFIHTVKWARR